MGLSILLRGTITEKLNWAFNLYDINKDGYITKEVHARTHTHTHTHTQYDITKEVHTHANTHKHTIIYISRLGFCGAAVVFSKNINYIKCVPGNAGHHEGDLRHDGEVHVPGAQRGDPTPTRGDILPGKAPGAAHPQQTHTQTDTQNKNVKTRSKCNKKIMQCVIHSLFRRLEAISILIHSAPTTQHN